MRPDAAERVRSKQLDRELRPGVALLRVAEVGDSVMFRDYTKSADKWAEGLVTDRIGPVTYNVRAQDGRTHKRHVDQVIGMQARKSRRSLRSAVDVRQSDSVSDTHEIVYDSEGDFYDGVGEESGDALKFTSPQSKIQSTPPPIALAKYVNISTHRKAALNAKEKIKLAFK
ncbi:unnamed protein product [Leptidea sinapis]|uniref:Uncharacterized protein n=1 Tax=Leptidea sinapis TaxID=189913 RepID=A0A5E4PY80_9NEOP|nr:unnamed protein product [Leptidea sinapis]